MPLLAPDLIVLVQCLLLGFARAQGMLLFMPFLSRQYAGRMIRTTVALALSLPTAWGLWRPLLNSGIQIEMTMVLLIKEALLGALLGMLAAIPFWTIRAMGTLIDNQRGANAAQQINPALQADATLLGELSERALVAWLIEWGLLQSVFATLSTSFEHWSVLDMLPTLDATLRHGLFSALAGLVTNAMILAAPVLVLLLLIELGLAITSTAVQGFDVYSSALAVKTIMAVVVLAIVAPGLLEHAGESALQWWRHGLPTSLGWVP